MSQNMTKRLLSLLCAAFVVAACDNSGAYRTTGITATGVVRGFVYFDANGSGSFDTGDAPMVGTLVRVVTPLSGDTVVRATTGADGTFRVAAVSVGSYKFVVDPYAGGDSADVQQVTPATVTLRANDSVSVEARVGFPTITTSQVRTIIGRWPPAGRPIPNTARPTFGSIVFVSGVALHSRAIYSDTLMHLVDATGAIRAVRVRATTAAAGDSVRLRGRIAQRDGQRVLDDVTVFVLGSTFIPTVPTINTLTASTADAGALDAALVRVLDAVVTDTATVAGSLTMTVDDGSGALTVLLDRVADIGFRAPFTFGPQAAGSRYDLVGVLVPSGTGSWVLRPRAVLDLTPR